MYEIQFQFLGAVFGPAELEGIWLGVEPKQRSCWQKPHRNLQRGDIVLLKEVDPPRRTWPIARILKTYPGRDSLTRVVNIYCGGRVYKRPIHKLVLLVSDESEPSSSGGEDVQASRQPSQESN